MTVAHSVEELEELLAEKEQESIFVYGGESVFKALLPKCDTAYVLYIEKSYDANRFLRTWIEARDGSLPKKAMNRPTLT